MAMLRLLKRLLTTLLMILLVWVIAVLPSDRSAFVIMPIVWSAIAFILVGTGIYLFKGHKKGLFCILLLGLCFGLSTNAFAQAEDLGDVDEGGSSSSERDAALKKYDIDELVQNYELWCVAADSFDVDYAIEHNTDPLNKEFKTQYDECNRYSYAYDLAVASKKIKETHWYKLEFESNTYEKAMDCAEDFLEKAAEYKIKSNEMALSTVRRVLEKDKDTCWPCGISLLVLEITEKISLALEDDLRAAALDLLGVMLLFWILYKVVALIGKWGTENLAEFFTQFLTRIIIAMIASAILANTANLNTIYSTLISPFIDATSRLTQKMVTIDSVPDNNTMAIQLGAEANLLQCGCCADEYKNIRDDEEGRNIPDCNGGNIISQKVNGGDTYLISRQSKRSLMCMTCSVYKQTAPMIAIGRVMTYASTHLGFWTRLGHAAIGGTIGVLIGNPAIGAAIGAAAPDPFNMWIVGMALIFVFTVLSAFVAFKLIDIFLKIGFVLLLTPFLVATFVFPATRTYTQRGWNFLVNAMLNILALGIGMAFILTCYQTTLPAKTTADLKALVSQAGDPDNNYAEQLYLAFTGNGDVGAFSTFLILGVFLFLGFKILDASQVIIETLSETSSGIPSLAGAAVMSMIRTVAAPLRLGAIILADHVKTPDIIKDRLKKDEDENPNDDKPGVFTKVGKWGGDGAEKAGNVAAKGAEAAGKATETAGQTAVAGGKATRNAGIGLIRAGGVLSGTGIGAIVGVPLMIAGATVAVAGTAVEVGGHLTKFAGKAVQKTSPLIKKAGKVAGKGIKQAGKKVQKQWNKTKRKIKNRIKQIPANIKKKFKQGLMKIKNAPKHLKNKLKSTFRRKKAKTKYGKKRMGRLKYKALRATSNAIDDALNLGDETVGKTDE